MCRRILFSPSTSENQEKQAELLKQKGLKKAYTDSNEALALDPANLKALYRRAVSENKLGLKAKACLDLEDCVKGDAKNVEANSLLDSLKNSVDNTVVDVTCFHKSEQIQSKKPLVRKLITEV